MTAKELIEKLKILDPDTRLLVSHEDYGYTDIGSLVPMVSDLIDNKTHTTPNYDVASSEDLEKYKEEYTEYSKPVLCIHAA